MKAIIYLILYLFMFSNSAKAGSVTYHCKINHVYELSDKGFLISSNPNWRNVFEGGEFSVSKDTGSIRGKTLTTINAESTQVINSSSNENSFKALAYFEEQIQLLEIQEFISGKNKPFIALSMGGAGIVSGICQ